MHADDNFAKCENSNLLHSCENLQNRNFFYPSAGQDFNKPIEKFLPFIDEFWFVDIAYDLSQPLVPEKSLKHLDTQRVQETGFTIVNNKPFKVGIRTDTYL
jgi:hypothetical protein